MEMIPENIYIQYFCGLQRFTTERVFDPSLFVDIRRRMRLDEFDKFNNLIIDKSELIKPKKIRIKNLEEIKKAEAGEEDFKYKEEEKKERERNHIEGKFGQAKRGYHMNNIKARLKNTSESWISAIIFVMNLTKLLMIFV